MKRSFLFSDTTQTIREAFVLIRICLKYRIFSMKYSLIVWLAVAVAVALAAVFKQTKNGYNFENTLSFIDFFKIANKNDCASKLDWTNEPRLMRYASMAVKYVPWPANYSKSQPVLFSGATLTKKTVAKSCQNDNCPWPEKLRGL